MPGNTPKDGSSSISKNKITDLYRNMILSRYMDNKMLLMLKQGKTYFHIGCSGHEAIQTAAAFAMKPGIDWAYPYYRDLAFVLQYGVTPYEIFLNALGKSADPSSGGRQMPQHYGHKGLRIVTQSSPTGTQFLQATGCALGSRKQKTKEIVYVSSGEGTTSQGDFHEALNWAARDKLPVIFVIQNNKYAISVPVEEQTAGKSVYKLGAGYEGLNRYKVNGTDLMKSFQVMREAVSLARAGKGPSLVEAETVRLLPHSSSDADKKYRSAAEIDADKKIDPIPQLEKFLIDRKIIRNTDPRTMMDEVKQIIDHAADTALAAEDPAGDSAKLYIFAPPSGNQQQNEKKPDQSAEKVVFVDAINHALKEEMEINPNIYIFGQDVSDGKGGVFTATSGISTQFGKERCFNAPLAESSIVGVAIGMAVRGLKPVIEIQFGDYIWTAMMQIRNELTTIRWRSNNNWASPVIIRVPVGGYIHGGLCHSQNIEAFFAHMPGLKIAYPSQADDAKGLLKHAIRGDDPVLFLEHKALYRQSYSSAAEPGKHYLLPFGKAAVRKQGTDATIVTYGYLVQKSLDVARELEKQGYSIEVIDIRTIVPLDRDTILSSVKRTGKVLVAHEDAEFHGFGSEIAAEIAEFAFEFLDGPVKRLAGLNTPIGYSSNLENAILPQNRDLHNSIKSLLDY